MMAWIDGLTPMERFYGLCALIGGALFVVRTLLMLIGADDDGGDVHQDSDAGFQFLSLQGLTAFFTMFGLVALALSTSSHAGVPVAVIGGLLAGVGTVWLLGRIFKAMKKLQADGTLRIERAIGETGEVYLRIPADGEGQVRVVVQGSLRVFDAVSADKVEIKTGARVRVDGVSGSRVLEVRAV